jgi:dephospho-CoA kinase
MRTPIIAVTGPIGSGKTMVARILASAGGVVIDCDTLARSAYDDPDLRRRVAIRFGGDVLTPSGSISRIRLARAVFSDGAKLEALNRLMKPAVTRIVAAEVRRRSTEAPYIVLDAVLYFKYTFRFKVDLVVWTTASAGTRLRRIMRRDGISREEAVSRIESQHDLDSQSALADTVLDTDRSLRSVETVARKIRDAFVARHIPGRTGPRRAKKTR